MCGLHLWVHPEKIKRKKSWEWGGSGGSAGSDVMGKWHACLMNGGFSRARGTTLTWTSLWGRVQGGRSMRDCPRFPVRRCQVLETSSWAGHQHRFIYLCGHGWGWVGGVDSGTDWALLWLRPQEWMQPSMDGSLLLTRPFFSHLCNEDTCMELCVSNEIMQWLIH